MDHSTLMVVTGLTVLRERDPIAVGADVDECVQGRKRTLTVVRRLGTYRKLPLQYRILNTASGGILRKGDRGKLLRKRRVKPAAGYHVNVDRKKKQAAQGEALSGLVGEVLRGGG